LWPGRGRPGRSAELSEFGLGLGEPGVFEGLALLGGLGQELAGLVRVPEPGVGDAEQVEAVGDAPPEL